MRKVPMPLYLNWHSNLSKDQGIQGIQGMKNAITGLMKGVQPGKGDRSIQ